LKLETSDNDNNQLATEASKASGGRQPHPQWQAMTNDESMRWMMMAAPKRARVARAMVTEMRAASN
jgi:hypothetical protein